MYTLLFMSPGAESIPCGFGEAAHRGQVARGCLVGTKHRALHPCLGHVLKPSGMVMVMTFNVFDVFSVV